MMLQRPVEPALENGKVTSSGRNTKASGRRSQALPAATSYSALYQLSYPTGTGGLSPIRASRHRSTSTTIVTRW